MASADPHGVHRCSMLLWLPLVRRDGSGSVAHDDRMVVLDEEDRLIGQGVVRLLCGSRSAGNADRRSALGFPILLCCNGVACFNSVLRAKRQQFAGRRYVVTVGRGAQD